MTLLYGARMLSTEVTSSLPSIAEAARVLQEYGVLHGDM